MKRPEAPPSAGEREMITTWLDHHRATVHAKCAGLSEAGARNAPLPASPLMTAGGIVRHLRWVENYWFQVVLSGREDHAPISDDDPDGEFRWPDGATLADLLADYEAECARSREVVAALDLDTPAKHVRQKEGVPFSVRWVILHMIEETARHNGHLDAIRELTDGVTGE